MTIETEPVSYTRVCRRCSAQSTTAGDSCPSCGTSFVRRSWRPSKRMLVLGGLVLLVPAAAAAGLLIKQDRDAAEADRAAAAIERAANEREAAEVAAQEEADEAEREQRADTVEYLESNITKHAKKAVKDGLLEGPILKSSCTAVGGSTDDLTALTATFDCLAVTKENKDGTMSGYSYSGTADWSEDGTIGWKLGG